PCLYGRSWRPGICDSPSTSVLTSPARHPRCVMDQVKGSRLYHVLVVDDDSAIRHLHTDLLTGAGYEVEVAADGAEALARVEARRPDIVLLDLDMPRVTGYEVCRRLKAQPSTRFIPVVILTGESAETARLQAWAFGADDFPR